MGLLYTVFFFCCELIQISGKMRPRFSWIRAAECPCMQTPVFTQLHNIHKCNSNSLRLPRLTNVYNGWQSSLVALSLGRLRQGRKHIWSHKDEGNTFYSFSLVQVLCCRQDYWLALSLVMFTIHKKDLQAVRDVMLSRLTAECFCL